MAYGKGLAYSQEIKGSIGKALTFSKNQHQNYVKFFFGKNGNKNKNASQAQLHQRSNFKMCNNLWTSLSQDQKDDFNFKHPKITDTIKNNFVSLCLLELPANVGFATCGVSRCGAKIF